MLLVLKFPKNLRISENSSIIFNFHKKIDEIREERKGPNKIEQLEEGLNAYEDRVEEELFALLIYLIREY